MVRYAEISAPVIWCGVLRNTSVHEVFIQASSIVIITLLLIFLQPAYANGGHIHLGGIFFLLLGGVVFLGGLFVVFYFLLRPSPDETSEESNRD
jgi:Kef-type K+ transport system membrane component KefB